MSVRATTPAPTRSAPRRRPTPNGGRLGLLAVSVWTEIRSSFRTADFAVGAIAVPVLLYAMFGLPNASSVLDGGTRVGLAMLVSMSAYGVVSLAIFTFGDNLAKERGRGWTRTLGATPFPTWVHLVGKVANGVLLAVLIVAVMFALAATAGGVSLPPGSWLALGATMVAGLLIFSTLGFAIAFLARPRTAAVIANLIFLPLAFASGFFVPLGELPQVLRDVAQFLPTFHFGQLAYRVVMPDGDVEAWTGAATGATWVHLTWVLGSAVVLAGLALLAARREAVTRRG
ncbi:ABC transporter permease [Georgenia subflava]|uniref:ABC transporter permease subunit n=1 Tax=Georgenia subflava TaxID=1622177 RepID=A0A6N7EGT3_9MICO|nr:ABC transporter permease [Georgenia subflava]MPV36373.1 ABC transporter permease subunit [Georgenia subflava]